MPISRHRSRNAAARCVDCDQHVDEHRQRQSLCARFWDHSTDGAAALVLRLLACPRHFVDAVFFHVAAIARQSCQDCRLSRVRRTLHISHRWTVCHHTLSYSRPRPLQSPRRLDSESSSVSQDTLSDHHRPSHHENHTVVFLRWCLQRLNSRKVLI